MVIDVMQWEAEEEQEAEGSNGDADDDLTMMIHE